MQFGKMLLVGAAAFAMVLGTVGCQTDDEGLEMFKVKNGAKSGRFGRGGADGFGRDADLRGFDSKSGSSSELDGGRASSWGKDTGLSPYDGFGTPITGLTFQPVYFRFDQSIIDSSEAVKLDEVAAYLTSNPGTGVVIEGNCDSKGSDEYNRGLGERRALAAKDYLLSKGIEDFRIRTVSYGEEKPAVPNTDDAARAKNRRDEFIGVTLKR